MIPEFINTLREVLSEPLPGREIQYKMAHHGREDHEAKIKPGPDVRVAGVLALLYPKNAELYLTLMRRTARGPHSGQVSFPGGGVEPEDENLEATALREAWEEVGIEPDDVEILGKLSSLFIPVSNALVNPFVGYSNKIPDYVIDPEEVQYVIEAPICDFLNIENIRNTNIEISEHLILKEVPYYHIRENVIWGATAMMMSEFLNIINQVRERSPADFFI
ncbi:MAG: CoA pyrophosphatase [Bacteroidota bacterium]